MKVLLTAIGGDISQSIAKILKSWDRSLEIIGTDMTAIGAGRHFCDRFVEVPPATSPDFSSHLNLIIKGASIDLLIPVNESEIQVIAGSEAQLQNNCKVVRARSPRISDCFDKLKTNQLLTGFGLKVPWTRETNAAPKEFPCVFKNRIGSGSKGLNILNSEEEFLFFSKRYRHFISQELLMPQEQELTCGVYRDRKGNTDVVILRRRLAGGLTKFAEVIEDKEVRKYCEAAANAMDLWGSINIQLINTSEGPKAFEINPRFSSTSIFRHQVGFQDVIWSIEELLEKPRSDLFVPERALGKRFYRVFSEIFED
ncbi:MAG: ATP-grasp domain-containing protein [Oligoflexia bacterium]|nr:ATP-grasp domain-containing protein [Oligoflexia bacterium]